MKLNYRRTLLVGLAFLSISAFWQVYDTVIPRILKYTFHLGDTLSGGIMALDNILALFLLPFFGTLSDKCRSRMGRRMPFIVGGTAVAVVLMSLLPLFDRQGHMAPFLVCMLLLLVALGTYRSPAVALMPDVTPKPLRSKGNAIINLMGAIGGVFSLIAIKLLVKTREMPDGTMRDDHLALFITVAVLMVAAVVLLVCTIRERKLVAETEKINATLEEDAPEASGGKLPAEVKKSLFFILISVSLWFMGYNAVTSAFSKYVQEVWGRGIGDASTCLLVGTVGAVVSYLPVGMLSSRWGRKRMIQTGVAVLAACFAVGATFAEFSAAYMYPLFALVGCAWAMINVNSYPMVVEISRSADVGKYTGYYYSFSMSAQILTPILSGFLLEHVGYGTLFPYAAIMVALSFVTISMARHGDSKPQPPQSGLEAFDTEG